MHLKNLTFGLTSLLLPWAAGSTGCGPAAEQTAEETISVMGQPATAAAVCTPPPSGIEFWLAGDGNANDLAGTADGTLMNGATFEPGFVTSGGGLGFVLDGVDDYIQTSAALSESRSMTYEAWVRTTVGGMVVSAADSDNNDGWATDLHIVPAGYGPSPFDQPGRVDFYVNDFSTSTYPRKLSTAGYNDGHWHHVAAAFENSGGSADSDLRLYIDGALADQFAFASNPYSSATRISFKTMRIGRSDRLSPLEAQFFHGNVDEMTVYNRALTADEIKAIYDAGSAGKCKRTKTVVFLQGINSTLACDSACSCTGSTNFDPIKNGIAKHDEVTWYSYQGGSYDNDKAKWCPVSYDKGSTSRDLGDSTRLLYSMLKEIDAQKPNSDFYLVGHSQGGLIAFQGIGATSMFANGSHIRAIVTLDAPLGYVPSGLVSYPALLARYGLDRWGEPAATEMSRFYETASQHSRQGTTARLLCSLFGACPDFGGPITNRAAVQANAARPDDQRIDVHTIGADHDDAVYDPRDACRIYLPGTGVDDTSSQVVEGANELVPMGGNLPQPSRRVTVATVAEAALLGLPPSSPLRLIGERAAADVAAAVVCAEASHDAVLTRKAAEVIGVIDGN